MIGGGGTCGTTNAALNKATITRILPDMSNAAYVPTEDGGVLLFRRDNTLMAQRFDPTRLQTRGGVMPIAEQVSVTGNVGYGAFTASRDGTVAYRSGIEGGRRQLVWVDRSGKRLGVVSKPDEINDVALSPDGKMVAFGLGNTTAGNSEVWLQNLETGVLAKLTSGTGVKGHPVWSPDNRRLAFSFASSTRTFSYQIQQMGAASAGGAEVMLEGPYTTLFVTDWSRDGKLIVFSSRNEKTKDDLWLLQAGGDRKAIPFLQSPADEFDGEISPNGQWMAYVSSESGRDDVYVQHVPPNGSKFQISAEGGAFPQWSADGKELFYLEGTQKQKLITVPVKTDSQFERGPARALFGELAIVGPFQPSADGQKFLTLLPAADASGSASITVVTNWQAPPQK
jgi:dipeptidyl aminopeptidase/acylaminoacyl peptidase